MAAARGPSAPLGELSVARKAMEEQQKLNYLENMLCGGLSRAAAQALCHPLNVAKTLLQARGPGSADTMGGVWGIVRGEPSCIFRGIFGQAALSIPNGAINFATLELAKSTMVTYLPSAVHRHFGAGVDLLASACGTLLSSLVSVPQTVVLDRIMAGQYKNFYSGFVKLGAKEGMRGYYRGWAPSMGSKIPSYALTWTFFQRFKGMHHRATGREVPSNVENFGLGAVASALTVCIMIPMDTVKTRLTTQPVEGAAAAASAVTRYTGIVNCFRVIVKEEGVSALYRALPPRLLSVVPMMGIQLCVYELARSQLTKMKLAADARKRAVVAAAAAAGAAAGAA